MMVMRGVWSAGVFSLGVAGLILSGIGCAGDPPKPAPTVTPEQVRGHADKAFDKLKQEESQRGADPMTAR